MFCAKCGRHNGEDIRFCRHCGANLEAQTSPSSQREAVHQKQSRSLLVKDPDELTSNGIGSIFMGDGFFMVAVILSATHTPVSSLLWLFLLIPAFFFSGKGFADVLYARQIRRKELNSQEANAFLPRSSSGELAAASVTEHTTRNLG